MNGVFELGWGDAFPEQLTRGAVSIGNFDGVHRGHQELIRSLRNEARRVGGPAVVVTFDPHPLRILAPERFMPLLTTIEKRSLQLLRAGADFVVVLQATAELLRIDAQTFVDGLIRDRLRANAVVEGFNFAFGRDRLGTTEFLQSWCERNGAACRIVSAAVGADGQPVSSSRVRTALERGDVESAARLLGRNYSIEGIVVIGDRRGASLGFPTANLNDIRTVIPGHGVYAVSVEGSCGKRSGACNIGPNPTFGVDQHKTEVHVIDWQGDLYDQPLAIEFVARLRDTRRFGSKDELIDQLHDDISRAKRKLRVADVAEFIDTEIAPAFSIESAAIEVLDVTDNIVRVRLNGTCASCPSTIMTLISGIEQELRKKFPDIEYLETML